MDIHRCRFVPFPVPGINAVAFSHPSTLDRKYVAARLALGRANGDVEIWNPNNGSWHQEMVIHGGKDRSIDGLAWVTDPDEKLKTGKVVPGRSRLFSIGYTTSVTEWDLENARPKREASGQHGDIWCLAAQPGPKVHTDDGTITNKRLPVKKLVCGTVDGSLVQYSIEGGDLAFEKIVAKSTTRKVQMVSMAFQSRHVCVVGCSDSTLRVYDMRNTNAVRRMTLGSDLAGGSREIIVWAVRCLPNGDIVSGDSTGHVCVWDGKTYTQAQRIQSHKQDVLSLAISLDGSMITSGGMDRRTVLYRKTGAGFTKWEKATHQRYHQHDVKAMASFETNKMSIVVSGGPDGTPIVIPLREMGREEHRALPHLPQSPPIQSAARARFLVSWWERSVHIWKLRQSFEDMVVDGEVDPAFNKNHKLLKTIVVKGEASITSAAISQEGSLLVVSTASDIKAFHLRHQDPLKPVDIGLGQIELPQALARQGATKIQISADGRWLCAVQRTGVSISRIHPGTDLPEAESSIISQPRTLRRLDREIPSYIRIGGLGSYNRNITQLAFSPDSKMIAVADLAGYIDTWTLSGQSRLANGHAGENASSSSEEDSSDEEEDGQRTGERWIRNPAAKLMPQLPAAPVVLSFSNDTPGLTGSDRSAGGVDDKGEASSNPYALLAITTSWQVLCFRPLEGGLTDWSRRNPAACLPREIRSSRDLAMGALWQGNRAWIYGISFIFMLDMDQDLPGAVLEGVNGEEGAANENEDTQNRRKRKRVEPDSGAGSKMKVGALGPDRVLKLDQDKPGGWEEMDLDDRRDPLTEDDDTANQSDEVAQLRRRGAREDKNGGQRKAWWHTYKYRPILGLVPLSSVDAGQLEVALVERPLWEADLPERYFGQDEYER